MPCIPLPRLCGDLGVAILKTTGQVSVECPSLQAQPPALQLYSQVFGAQNTQKGRVPISAAQLEAAIAICLHTDDVHFGRLVKGCVTAPPPPSR